MKKPKVIKVHHGDTLIYDIRCTPNKYIGQVKVEINGTTFNFESKEKHGHYHIYPEDGNKLVIRATFNDLDKLCK